MASVPTMNNGTNQLSPPRVSHLVDCCIGIGPNEELGQTNEANSSAPTLESAPSPTLENEPSIYRVPECYRGSKPEAYCPAVVSFGPYYHQTSKHLQQMEMHKHRVLERLIHSNANGNINNDMYVAVRQKLPTLMGCFAEFMWKREDEYVRILIHKHGADKFAPIVAREIPVTSKRCNIEGIVNLVRGGVEEFTRCLINDVDDTFCRLMVSGNEISHLMIRHDVKNNAREVIYKLLESRTSTNGNRDNSEVREPPGSNGIEEHLSCNVVNSAVHGHIQDSNLPKPHDSEDLACRMLRMTVEKFLHSLIKDGLDTLTHIMVRDGLFMTLLFEKKRQCVHQEHSRPASELKTPLYKRFQSLGLLDNDHVFGTKARENLWPYIKRDMLLIENQIPFWVLKTLLTVLAPAQFEQCSENEKDLRTEWLNRHVVQFFDCPDSDRCSGGQHILELYRNCRLLREPPVSHSKIPAESVKIYYLKGVKVEQSRTDCFNDFRFKKQSFFCSIFGRTGTIYIPKLQLSDTSHSVIPNLVAFEALHSKTDKAVTLYVIYMARLLRKRLYVKVMDYNMIDLSPIWTKEVTTEYFQRLTRGIQGAQMKKNTETSPKWMFNVLLWPSLILRFSILFLIADTGRLIGYIALILAFISFLVALLKKWE